MKKIFSLRFQALTAFVMLAGLLVGCNENEVAKTDEVQLLSFGPSGVMPGDTISFIGRNLDKVTSIELTGASIAASAFLKQTPERITLKVPDETSEGLVTLKTSQGDIVSKTILSLEVAVKILKIPTQAKPGENITITGAYLNWVKGVTFASDTTVTEFVSQTMTELVVTVPFGAQTGLITFSAGGTEPLSIESETELVVALPALKSFAPALAEREKNLTIAGTNLDLTMGVLFTGVINPITEFVSKAPSQLVVKIPKEAKKGKVSLIAYSGIPVVSADTLKFVGEK
jgi:RNase P/RNase MRP subunit p29